MRVLDTDVCVELLRGNREVIEHRRRVTDAVATSWVTAAELYYGAEKSKAPTDNRLLVTDFLATLEILGFDLTAAQRFGEKKARLESTGRRLADADLLIAAISLSHGAVLVTGNTRHYERIDGLQLESWFPR